MSRWFSEAMAIRESERCSAGVPWYAFSMSEASGPQSPLLALLEQVEREVHLRRRDLIGRLAPIEASLAAYRRAVEEQAALQYASSHSLARPSSSGLSPEAAARQLLEAVRALPELPQEPAENRTHGDLAFGETESTPATDSARPAASSASSEERGETKHGESKRGTALRDQAERGKVGGGDRRRRPLSEVLPRVATACQNRRLAVVGALSGRRKPLPPPLEEVTEWVDTQDGGGKSVGNLPQRIRQGRLFGVIICDQAVAHKHTDPLVAAARASGVPIGFAAKGGAGSIARALEAIEEQLESAEPGTDVR